MHQILIFLLSSLLTIFLYISTRQPYLPKYAANENDVIITQLIGEGVISDNTSSNLRLRVSHAFIGSVYYYPKSKSFGDNTIIISMAIDQRSHDIRNHKITVISSDKTDSITSKAESELKPSDNCRYTNLIARANGIPNLQKLEIESEGQRIQIPFKMARYTAPKPVIICISPQFVAEQWQMFVMHVHVANRFGGHLHMYVTSMIESYFELMKEYERRGYMTLDFWLRMKFSESQTPYFEPNGNIEWRNQAGAETDCLLQYKEAAEYIAFFDIDDMLFPNDYPTYQELFNSEFELISADSLVFERKELKLMKVETLAEFSIKTLVSSSKISGTIKTGKVVVRPSSYNSPWIAYSENRTSNLTLGHFKLSTGDKNDKKKEMSFLKEEDLKAIEEDLKRFKSLPIITIHPLPKTEIYHSILSKCYHDAFSKKNGCPNADSCQLPQQNNHKCVHSHANYLSGPDMEPVTYHFAKDPHWSKGIDC